MSGSIQYLKMNLRDLRKMCISKKLSGITNESTRQQCMLALLESPKMNSTDKHRGRHRRRRSRSELEDSDDNNDLRSNRNKHSIRSYSNYNKSCCRSNRNRNNNHNHRSKKSVATSSDTIQSLPQCTRPGDYRTNEFLNMLDSDDDTDQYNQKIDKKPNQATMQSHRKSPRVRRRSLQRKQRSLRVTRSDDRVTHPQQQYSEDDNKSLSPPKSNHLNRTSNNNNNSSFAGQSSTCLHCNDKIYYNVASNTYDDEIYCNDCWWKKLQGTFDCEKCKISYCVHSVTSNHCFHQSLVTLSKVVDKLKKIAEDKDGLDIYQAAATVNITEGEIIPTFCTALITSIGQILSCCLLTYHRLNEYRKSHENIWCNNEHGKLETILAICLVVLSCGIVKFNFVRKLSKDTLYLLMELYSGCYYTLFDDLINRYLIIIGYFVNVIVMILTICGSCAIVYTAEDVVDLVLNCVALYFIIEIDDLIVPFWVYGKLKKFVDSNDKNLSVEGILHGKKIIGIDTKSKYTLHKNHENQAPRKIVNGLHSFIYAILDATFFFGIFAMPFIILFCY